MSVESPTHEEVSTGTPPFLRQVVAHHNLNFSTVGMFRDEIKARIVRMLELTIDSGEPRRINLPDTRGPVEDTAMAFSNLASVINTNPALLRTIRDGVEQQIAETLYAGGSVSGRGSAGPRNTQQPVSADELLVKLIETIIHLDAGRQDNKDAAKHVFLCFSAINSGDELLRLVSYYNNIRGDRRELTKGRLQAMLEADDEHVRVEPKDRKHPFRRKL